MSAVLERDATGLLRARFAGAARPCIAVIGFEHIAGQLDLDPELLWPFQGSLLDKDGHRVVVAGVGLATQAQRLQGDRPAAGEGIQHARAGRATSLDILHGDWFSPLRA